MNPDIRKKIIRWNLRFPMDRVWRKKYNVAFNSPAHRESNFLDQLFDIEEDSLFNEYLNNKEYIPNVGDWLKRQNEDLSIEDSIGSMRQEFEDDFGDMEELD
jgi:hypothetical protein